MMSGLQLMGPGIDRWWRRKFCRDELERVLGQAFEVMNVHLGNSSLASGERVKGEKRWTIFVGCLSCGRRNRLLGGVMGARCGACGESFCGKGEAVKEQERLSN